MKYRHFKLKLRAIATFLVMFVISATLSAQKTSISGIVKDASTGEVILGANIFEKGTSNGTITNLDGQFTLSVAANATLLVKYVGYSAMEVPVAGKTNLIIQLKEDAIALGEVVAIGYGTVKKNDATGSVTAIKPDKLNKGLTTNAQDMIIGKIAGVSVITDGGAPGAGAQIRIRGGSSLSAQNDPLIVIDGLAMDNDGLAGLSNPLSSVNPNDIESFTVLKDASATAIYGSRASNGVIIITTKKGDKKDKLRVSYDGNFSVSSVKKTLDVLNAAQFRELVNKLYPGGSTDPKINTNDSITRSLLGNEDTDWQSQIYQNAFSHDHNINLYGGYKNVPYRVSVGYTNQNGILKTSNFERYTGAISLSPSLLDDHLKINLNAKGMLVNNQYADGGAVGAASAMDPTQPVTSTDPIYVNNFGGYWQWYNAKTVNGVTTYPYNSLAVKNPLATLNQKDDKATAKEMIASADIDYKFHFLPELRAHLNLGIDDSKGRKDLYIVKEAASDEGFGRMGYENMTKTNKSLNFYMQFAKEISKHKFDVMGGYEWQHFARSGDSKYQGLTKNVYNKALNDSVGFNYYENVWKTESFLVSFFGRLNYSYGNKYLATVTLREDGTSRFSPENRWGLFPAAAFAWKINEEEFMKDLDVFSDLKLRLGYGITGQQNINQGDYPYIPVYQLNQEGAFYPTDSTYHTTYRPNAYNSKLKWEQTATSNVGLDFGVLKGRITGSLDYYMRKTTDLINVVDVPAGSNFSNRVISNIGSLQNQGVEFSINVKAISTKDLIWEIGYNATYNQNKITKLISGTGENYKVATGGISSGVGSNIQAHAVGHPASSFFVYHQVYDSITGKPIEGTFLDKNGKVTTSPVEDDKYYFKKPTADVTMGLSSKLIYKNFDLGISLRASLGNYVYNDVAASRSNMGAGIVFYSGYFSNRPVSALYTDFKEQKTFFSDYYVQDASFLRCDNITLGYSFKNLYDVISSGRFYITAQNPFFITKYKGLDPELSSGIDNNIYPRPMITVIGLSLNF
jgi:iron complex outermembrane receptor protein